MYSIVQFRPVFFFLFEFFSFRSCESWHIEQIPTASRRDRIDWELWNLRLRPGCDHQSYQKMRTEGICHLTSRIFNSCEHIMRVGFKDWWCFSHELVIFVLFSIVFFSPEMILINWSDVVIAIFSIHINLLPVDHLSLFFCFYYILEWVISYGAKQQHKTNRELKTEHKLPIRVEHGT